MFTDKVNKECFLENFGAAFLKPFCSLTNWPQDILCSYTTWAILSNHQKVQISKQSFELQLEPHFRTIKKSKLVNKVLNFC